MACICVRFMRATLQTQSVGSFEPSCMVVVNSFGARGSGERRHSKHLELPLSGLYVPGWQGSQRTPFMISLPASHSHLALPSGRIVWMKPSWQTQSLMEVDEAGEVENSGQRKQAVPRSEPSSGLYVPSVQSTMRPACGSSGGAAVSNGEMGGWEGRQKRMGWFQ